MSYFLYSIVSYCSGLITSAGGEKAHFFCYRLLVIMWFPFGGVSSSSLYYLNSRLYVNV